MKALIRLSTEVGRRCESALRSALLFAIGAYRTIGTSYLGGSCRFEPSCSAYAAQAARSQAPVRAMALIVKRILRCRPGGSYGFDPPPPAPSKAKETVS